ncbi:DUF4189 domain-containing protein [Gordonia sp. X0973]|uniref:DUF4189 domain-containing protein n=1 Tax=Gordonia sp. X0973 TaxID=2742602 RepID=UPI000F51DD37|nr:DUF4189 domain-containing protein [Gordonia sp. X0973]QKT07741.1 DUF4189 domain-containing protein [Gordonia sp. X0973]
MIARKHIAALGISAALATGGALLPTAAPSAHAYTYNYGAIAYSQNQSVAYAVNYPSARAAANAAYARCGAGCGYFTFYNSCGAVAYSPNRIGKAWGYRTAAGAKAAARRQAGWGGRVRIWACTSR